MRGNGAWTAVLLATLAGTLACGPGTGGSADGAPQDPADPPGQPPPSDAVAAAILKLHDDARASATPTPSPALPALGWSASAASAAQSWANGCSWGHDPALRALKMGQNIYAKGSSSASVAATVAEVVGSWVSEKASYTYATNSCATGQQCGHYTQVVWRSTTSVGCAHALCHVNSPFMARDPSITHWDFWVCNYVPPGNYSGQRPY